MAQAEYPKLYEHTRACMPCAKAENKMAATLLLNDICPVGYIVDEVYPFPSKTKPYCRWLVKFTKANDEELPLPGKELKKVYDKLTRYVPAINAKVFSKHHGGSFATFITYAVICDCKKPLNFEFAALLSTQIKWPPVKEEVTDLSMINFGMGNLDLDIFKTETE